MTEVPEDQVRDLERGADEMEEGLGRLQGDIDTAQQRAAEQRERAEPDAVGDEEDESGDVEEDGADDESADDSNDEAGNESDDEAGDESSDEADDDTERDDPEASGDED